MWRELLVCLSLLAPTGAWALDPEIALEPPPVIEQPGSPYADENRAWQGIPGIEKASNGRLWATWYSGGVGEGALNYVLLVTSEDDGESWSAPRLAVDPVDPVRAYDPCLWTDPQGRLWLFWAQSAGLWDGRGGVWAIVTENPADESPRWSKPRRIADGVMMNKPTALDNGDWLLPISGWRFKAPRIEKSLADIEFPDPPGAATALARSLGSRNGSMVYESTDQGRTFRFRGQALVPEPQHDEHMVVQRRDGSLWMVIRTAYGIGESVSADQGVTWSAGGASGIEHPVTRFFVRRLNSGRLLLVRNNPDDSNPGRTNMTAYLSDDDGGTWSDGLLLDGRRSVSYPDAVEAPDGTLFIIYDRERGGAKEILMARIREDDILAGRITAKGSKLQLLVNRATGSRPDSGR